MKTLIALALVLIQTVALAQTACGYPPYPPYGMVAVCICDSARTNCSWVFVSKN